MADGYFIGLHGGNEIWQVVEIQVMACVDAESELARSLRGCDKIVETVCRSVGTAVRKRCGIRLRVELNSVRSCRMRGFDACDVGINKHTHANAFCLQARDELMHRLHFVTRSKATIGGRRVHRVGDERCLLRQRGFYNLHQVVMRIAFDIELAICVACHQRSKGANIIEPNMSLIRSWVNRDARSTRVENSLGGAQQVRQPVIAAVSKQGDSIDVGRKMSHGGRRQFANG